jgi:hypothetical protein
MHPEEPPATEISVPSPLEVLDATAEALQNYEAPGCPRITATVNGSSLILTCNAGRERTFQLLPGGDNGPVLAGKGGFILPVFPSERWRALAAVVPMTAQQGGHAFDLGEIAASLGFEVHVSSLILHWKYSHTLKLLRLEHPDGREVWGTVFVEESPDGQVNDALLLGGVIVARVRCDATYEDAAIAQMSDADLTAEHLTRPDASVFKGQSFPLTSRRLQAVLNALETGTAHTLAFPELALGS